MEIEIGKQTQTVERRPTCHIGIVYRQNAIMCRNAMDNSHTYTQLLMAPTQRPKQCP